jgi:hypothetical protein
LTTAGTVPPWKRLDATFDFSRFEKLLTSSPAPILTAFDQVSVAAYKSDIADLLKVYAALDSTDDDGAVEVANEVANLRLLLDSVYQRYKPSSIMYLTLQSYKSNEKDTGC